MRQMNWFRMSEAILRLANTYRQFMFVKLLDQTF